VGKKLEGKKVTMTGARKRIKFQGTVELRRARGQCGGFLKDGKQKRYLPNAMRGKKSPAQYILAREKRPRRGKVGCMAVGEGVTQHKLKNRRDQP